MALAPKRLILLSLLPATLAAQHTPYTQQDSTHAQPVTTNITTPSPATPHYWRNLSLGFISSIAVHEAAHLGTSLAVGAHPHLGFDKGRPTIYSGISAYTDRHKQFLFSSAGLTAQAILDEAILDIPHPKGSPFERGILTGGIATALFYATLGRNASNSDITFMARTSSLSKTQASLIYVGLATVHTLRIAHDKHYANFFVRPNPTTSGLTVGVAILPE